MHQIKVQPKARRTYTVRELANSLDMRERETLEACRAAGEYVSSPHSHLEEPAARRVVAYLEKTWPFPDPEQSPVQAPSPPPMSGLPPARPQPRRDNHPMMTPESRGRDFAREYWRDRPPRPSRSRLAPTPPDPAQSDPTARAFREAEQDGEALRDYSWMLRGFTEVEKDEWVACGLLVGQARLAASLRNKGFVPTDLLVELVRARLTRGDGVDAVRLLLGKPAKQKNRDEAV